WQQQHPPGAPSLPGLRARTQAVAVAERPPLASDDLVILMALAGDEDGVAGTRLRDRRVDGQRTITLDAHPLRPADAAQDHRDDAVGILATGIVIGDDDAIGEALGSLAHERAFARVALAAAAKYEQHAS